VNNACATIAVMNGILNIPSLEVGQQLEHLREFAPALDPQVLISPLSRRLRLPMTAILSLLRSMGNNYNLFIMHGSNCSPVER
jgi:hypothetical protein